MRDPLILVVVLVLGLPLGCTQAHETQPDAATPDTNTDARDPCTVAGILRCDSACGRNMSACWHDAAPDDECIAGLCLPVTDATQCQGYGECQDSRRVCVKDSTHGGGGCVLPSFCLEAAAEGYPLDCAWSGPSDMGTPYVTGAPTDATACPPGATADSPFCGAPCVDACSNYTRQTALPFENRGSCVGRSDSHQFGLCVPSAYCHRGMTSGQELCDNPLTPTPVPEFGANPCVCLVWRRAATPDGLSDTGFLANAASCAAYRALYPGDFDCVTDADWHVLP